MNDELEKYYKSAYSKMELPDNEAGNLVKSMVEPYKGKYVLINMFSPLIPESRSELEYTKGFRQKNQDNKDFKIVYAVSEELILPQLFDSFVQTQMPGEDIKRLPSYKNNLIRGLFEFQLIPHYVLIDRNGTVVAKHFGNMQSFMKFLDSKGIKYKL